MNDWHHTSRTPRFFAIDARIIVVLFIFILHISWLTLYLSLSLMIPMIVAEYSGMTLPMVVRRFRSLLAGRQRPARRKRRLLLPY